jgi:hypothetical protein
MRLHPIAKWNDFQASSASVLSHFETPLAPAFLLYPAFSCGVQRNSTRAVEGFLMGGLPRGRLGGVMVDIVPVQIMLDKPLLEVHSCTYMKPTIKQMAARANSGHIAVLKRLLETGTYGRELDHACDIHGLTVCFKTLRRWGCIEDRKVTGLGLELLRLLSERSR